MNKTMKRLVVLVAMSLLFASPAFAVRELFDISENLHLSHFRETEAVGQVRQTEAGLEVTLQSVNYAKPHQIIIGFTVPVGYKIAKLLSDKDGEEEPFGTQPGRIFTTSAPANKVTLRIYLEKAKPEEPGEMQKKVEKNVDMTAKVETIDHGVRVTLDADGIFPVNEGNLSPKMSATVRRMLSNIKPAELERITIEGHTDSTGSYEYNMRLSQQRAAASVPVLLEMGFKKEQIVTVGYADTKPVADNSTEEGRAQNRRIEFSLIKKSR